MKKLLKKNKLDIRNEIQDFKKKYRNEEDYSIEELKDKIKELNYFIKRPKSEVFFDGIKEMMAFIAIIISLVTINIALDEPLDKTHSQWISNFCVKISTTITIIVIFIVITVCIIDKEKDEVAKKIIEIDVIQDELNRREEKKINRYKRIHENIRR